MWFWLETQSCALYLDWRSQLWHNMVDRVQGKAAIERMAICDEWSVEQFKTPVSARVLNKIRRHTCRENHPRDAECYHEDAVLAVSFGALPVRLFIVQGSYR